MSSTSSLREYSTLSAGTDQLVDKRNNVALLLAGLFGEIGSILTEVKKASREADAYPVYRQRLLEEFGDALWYYTRLLAVLAPSDVEDLVLPGGSGSAPPNDPLSSALSLGEAMGALLRRFHSKGSRSISKELRVLWKALCDASHAADVSLQAASQHNLQKIRSRWPESRQYVELFDVDYPEEEQLPRSLDIEFRERDIRGRKVVVIRSAGLNIGNRVTDNMQRPDAYRFHDVFHFAYAVYLGWSPVVRALLNCKRKSTPNVDENQDGARARVIEEGVSATVFARGKGMAHYDGVDQVDYDLLKTVHGFVNGLEVECVPLWQWETAILQGHSVFRALTKYGGGHVRIDLRRRDLRYIASPTPPAR